MSGRLQLILATKEMKKKSYEPIIDLDQDSSRELSVFEDQYSCEVFKRFLAYQHIFRKFESSFADFVCGAMSPLLRDVKEEINNQGRSQTSEQDEASLEGRMPKARIPWNFSSEKSILDQNQDEAIASPCLMLATALIISNTFILYYLRIQFHLLRMPKVGRLQRVVFLVSSSS